MQLVSLPPVVYEIYRPLCQRFSLYPGMTQHAVSFHRDPCSSPRLARLLMALLEGWKRERSDGTSSGLQLLQRLMTMTWRVDLPFCMTRCWIFDGKREYFV